MKQNIQMCHRVRVSTVVEVLDNLCMVLVDFVICEVLLLQVPFYFYVKSLKQLFITENAQNGSIQSFLALKS